MRMEAYGASLLNGIEVDDLRDILRKARLRCKLNSEFSTGVTVIDRVSSERTQHSTVAPWGQRYPVIELISAGPTAGKSHLIYHAIASITLPCTSSANGPSSTPDCNSAKITTGNGGCAVVLDTDGRFSVSRLAQVMRKRILESVPPSQSQEPGPSTESHLESLISQALEQVYVFAPQSMQQMISIIQEIPTYLDPHGSNWHCRGRTFDLLVVDSLSAFFWQTAFSTEWLDTEEGAQDVAQDTRGAEAPQPNSNLYAKLVANITDLQQCYACSVIATNCSFSPLSSSTARMAQSGINVPALRTLLPSVWTSFCTLRLGLAREPVTRFPHGMSLDNALCDRPARLDVVEQGKFHAWIEPESKELARRAFTFRIDSRGISVD